VGLFQLILCFRSTFYAFTYLWLAAVACHITHSSCKKVIWFLKYLLTKLRKIDTFTVQSKTEKDCKAALRHAFSACVYCMRLRFESILKAQPREVNARWKRMSQCSFKKIINYQPSIKRKRCINSIEVFFHGLSKFR